MSRPNYINFVEHLYRYDINFSDIQIENMLFYAYEFVVSRRTLSVWKVRLRKKGLLIPDSRKKETNDNNRVSP